MMAERPAPRWIIWLIRFLQGDPGVIEGVALGAAGGLALMMAIGMLVAWQKGLL